jgi:hypothetical protein
MLLTNHTLTGVLLGLTIDDLAILAPVGVASHLALDMVPHFGHPSMKSTLRAKSFIVLGSFDFTVSCLVTVAACLAMPQRAGHILVGVIGADLPDLTYIPIIVFGQKLIYRIPGYRAMIDFLGGIQWFERPIGLITEYLWAALMLILLSSRLG